MFKSKKYITAGILTIALLTSFYQNNSKASGVLGYNSVAVGYSYLDADAGNVDSFNGINLSASYSPIDNFYFFGGVEYSESSGSFEDFTFDRRNFRFRRRNVSFDIENQSFWLGVGGYYPIKDNLHVTLSLTLLYLNTEIDAPNFSDDDDSFGLTLGPTLRYAIASCWEINAGINLNYVDVDEDSDIEDTTVSFNFGTVVDLTNHISLLAGVGYDSEETLMANGALAFTW